MARRLVRWFFFNLLFALTPLTVVLVIKSLLGQLSFEAMEDNLSEILFFSLMVSVTALDDLDEIISVFKNDLIMASLKLFLIFGAVWSAMLYSIFMLDSAVNLNFEGFRSRLLSMSIAVAIILFLVSTTAECIVARVVSSTNKTP